MPAVLAIWSPGSEEKLAGLPPMEPDWGFRVSTLVSIAAIFALGILYDPAINIIEAGIRLM